MTKGHVRRMFPGGITHQGFYSFYDNMIEPNATRIFVIKGGPGVGKSTFMKKIADKLLDDGKDLEFHNCSSDNNSLDGVVITSKNIAMLDGTAPHVVDPKNPGAVDEILNFGQFWDESKMIANKEQILASNKQCSRYFQIAYSRLKEAKAAYDEWESYVTESMDFAKLNTVSKILLEEVFSLRDDSAGFGKVRRLFASSITPQGLVHFYPSLLNNVKNLLLLNGSPGSGKSTILQRVVDNAVQKGYFVEAYHCPIDPTKLDLVIIPAIQTALLNNTHPIKLSLDGLNAVVKEFDLNTCRNDLHFAQWKKEAASAEKRFEDNLAGAIGYIAKAKETHDLMETYYVPNIDFKAIDQYREEIYKRILNY